MELVVIYTKNISKHEWNGVYNEETMHIWNRNTGLNEMHKPIDVAILYSYSFSLYSYSNSYFVPIHLSMHNHVCFEYNSDQTPKHTKHILTMYSIWV